MNVNLRAATMTALLAMPAGLSMPAFSQNRSPPDVFDLSSVKFEIVNATFVTKLDSAKAQFAETKPNQYHGLIVTVRITKEPGSQISLTCQDISLHYRFGDDSDVARCYGLSSYSTQLNEDRVMALYSQGWGKTTTGPATTQSGAAYVDVFFQNMEPTTRDLYLFMAQPTGAHYVSNGWNK